MTSATVIATTLVALAAIGAASVAVVQGSIDGSSFSAIIGAAVGASSSSAGAVIVHAANGRKERKHS